MDKTLPSLMFSTLWNFILKIFGVQPAKKAPRAILEGVRILKHSAAQRVVFFYPGEEGTYVENPTVTLFENGIVHIRAKSEETTTHLSHCEILWKFEANPDAPKGKEGKIRVVNFSRSKDEKPEPPAPNS